MALDNFTIFVFIATALIYLLVYRKNRLFGNIAFIGIGIGLWSTLEPNQGWLGLIIVIGGFISLIYDILTSIKR